MATSVLHAGESANKSSRSQAMRIGSRRPKNLLLRRVAHVTGRFWRNMSKFTPWDESEAENEAFNRMVYGKRLSPHQQEIWLDALAWAAAQIEKCPSLYRNASHFRELWDIRRNPEDTHEAKLVGVREVEK